MRCLVQIPAITVVDGRTNVETSHGQPRRARASRPLLLEVPDDASPGKLYPPLVHVHELPEVVGSHQMIVRPSVELFLDCGIELLEASRVMTVRRH
eukprot:9186718-Pyramimonas_sp.AAC.1